MKQRQWDALEQAVSDLWTAMQAANLDAWSREVLIRYLLDEIQDGDPADAMRRFRKVVTVEGGDS